MESLPKDTRGMKVPYELRASPIAGVGLFATEPIPRGAMIWKCDDQSCVFHTEASILNKISQLNTEKVTELLSHAYAYAGKVMEVLGDGKYENHSHINQNTGNHPDGLGDGESSYALRDI
mgnify:CR=1 FL=1